VQQIILNEEINMEGIGIWQLVIVFFILLLIFGSKKIKNLGKDLGESIRGFKDSVSNENTQLEKQVNKEE
jgi:sec-independent protein translocase protein TatA